jgi:transmembrane sensor
MRAAKMSTMRNPAEAAAYWHAQRLSGEMKDEQWREMRNWLEEPENREAFEALERAISATDEHEETLLAQAFESELNALAGTERRRHLPFTQIAASIAALFIAGLGVFLFTPLFPPAQTTEQYATVRGAYELVRLDDGSAISLNTSSALSVDYSAKERRVALTAGEAFFDVARNPDRPFIIAVPSGQVVVTGTSFNVRLKDQVTTVSVISGAVDVRGHNDQISTIIAGQSVSLDDAGNLSAVFDFDPTRTTAWRDGKARFTNTPLNEAVAELNRYFSRPIVLQGASLDELRVSGEFSVRDDAAAARALAIAFDLEATVEDDSIVLAPQVR